MFASELMVPKELEYDKRIEIFKTYIHNDIKCHDANDKSAVITTLRKLIIILFLPIHTKSTKVNKNNIKIVFYCNHSGKTKETCKGRDCGYKLIVTLGFDNVNSVTEMNEHKHPLDYFFVVSKTCPLLKSEKHLIPKTNNEIIKFLANHPHIQIPLRKFRQIQREEDRNQILENIFLSESFFENDSFIKLTNTFTNGYIHSILFIHNKVNQMEYSQRRWYVDDTAKTNIYNKNLYAVIVKDDNSFNQFLSFGYLFDQSENSYKLFLHQLHNILNYGPEIIVCDRSIAQYNALKHVFPHSKLFFCRIHIERSLIKYFKSDHIIMKLFHLTMNMKLNEDDLIETWKSIVMKNIKNLEEDTDDESRYHDDNESSDEENDEHLFEPDTGDVINSADEPDTSHDNIQQMMEEAKGIHINKGLMCIIDLIEHKENWIPSECIKYGMYRDFTTNRVEGFFGHLKKIIKHSQVPFYLLTDNVYALGNTMFNNIIGIDLPEEIIDNNDPHFTLLSEFAKKVLKTQYKVLTDHVICDEKQYCISCQIRHVNPAAAWPCCHLMKERRRMSLKHLISYEDLPSFAFKSKQTRIKWTDKSISNIEMPTSYSLMGSVIVNKMRHNTNVRPRNKVEFRKRKSKEVFFNEIAPFQMKKCVVSEQGKRKQDERDSEGEHKMRDDEENIEEQGVEERLPTIDSETSNIQTPQSETYKNELREYDSMITEEEFEKIMKTFKVPPKCMVCGMSKNNNIYKLPHNIKEKETIIFPFLSKNKYGIIAYVKRINIAGNEREECMVRIKYGNVKYPAFMRGMNRQIMKVLELTNEPIIYSIKIDECIEQLKQNGYITLFLMESFIKKRKDDEITGKPKKLREYISIEKMIESFKNYKEINSN
ncbi:hypothetical protein EDI_194320 [Entamoeba dispar SAW760]|uniref:MULE transposase domain-containing protein n=1 Tax=Entamoeba dispar (strain ATCC PRA-260 / SAW760) TaxID=370354 RepID=B0EAD6_ENTDS|nr:uncharacterized protein EDI_194320 [Entamoeba dispar SAW760]EDR28521.1 hypothetical protein EDI_194320 [Entamoeba dispar SAW760]|eukprot:EDR28521.1 hypothetical protein EDI_194320 [Entamoeba dispar SAW760]